MSLDLDLEESSQFDHALAENVFFGDVEEKLAGYDAGHAMVDGLLAAV